MDFTETIQRWPPTFTESQIISLVTEATSFALAHGLSYLPSGSTNIPLSSLHAPLTIIPSPYPRHLFERAQSLQHVYNKLYSYIASHPLLLDDVLGEDSGIGRVEPFTGKLWRGWKELREQNAIVQNYHLGLFRSDYMLHQDENGTLSLKQVEFNTISSSFGSLSSIVSSLHRHLYNITEYFGALPSPNIPHNNALVELCNGLAEAHQVYGAPGAVVLMVVQDEERNIFDQRLLEYELFHRHNIKMARATFATIAKRYQIEPSSGILRISLPASVASLEISVVYYRAGYTPTDYPSESIYNVRFDLERSRAIKCPSIPLQLAGTKKMQEHLTCQGVLEGILSHFHNSNITPNDVADLKDTWMSMWSLSGDGYQQALERFQTLVVKPQREGGGNNIYRNSIPQFLADLPNKDREAWIAMQLINAPHIQNFLVQTGDSEALKLETVSELGIFGWSLFCSEESDIEVREAEAGWLLRTKSSKSDEGGIAVGISVLDSPLLI